MQHQWHAGGGGGRTKSESGKAGRVSSGGGVPPRDGGRGNYGTQLLVARESLDRDSQQPDNSCTPQLFGCGALPTCHLPCNVNIARKINTSVYVRRSRNRALAEVLNLTSDAGSPTFILDKASSLRTGGGVPNEPLDRDNLLQSVTTRIEC